MSVEYVINKHQFERYGLLHLLGSTNLIKSASFTKVFIVNIVQDFYYNLQNDIIDKDLETFTQAAVKGQKFNFNPAVVNKFLGHSSKKGKRTINLEKIAKEIVRKVVARLLEGGTLSSTKLMMKYAILQKLLVRNWLSSDHKSTVKKEVARILYKIGKWTPFNLGKVIFDQIMSQVEPNATREFIPFPSLVYQILIEEQNILFIGNEVYVTPHTFKIRSNLFSTNHFNDL